MPAWDDGFTERPEGLSSSSFQAHMYLCMINFLLKRDFKLTGAWQTVFFKCRRRKQLTKNTTHTAVICFFFFLTQQYNSGWNPGKSGTGPWWGAGSLRRWSSGKSSFIHTEKLKADIVRGHCLHSGLRDLLGMNTCLIWPWSTWFPSQILQQGNSRPL